MDPNLIGQLPVVIFCGVQGHMGIGDVMSKISGVNEYFGGVPFFKCIDQFVIAFLYLPGKDAVLMELVQAISVRSVIPFSGDAVYAIFIQFNVQVMPWCF
jgi:hypothetical protein